MRLTSNGYNCTIMPPDYGYTVIHKMAIKAIELSNKQYDYFDAGQANDTIVLSIPAIYLSRTDALTLSNFLLDEDTGRGRDLTLDLQTDIGFWPAGPMHGNTGTFTLKLLDMDFSEILDDPYLYFSAKFNFIVIPLQSYTLPLPQSEGLFQICDIPGLRYPPEGFIVKNKYSYDAMQGYGGNVSDIDTKISKFETKFKHPCNHENASNLHDCLVNNDNGRTNQIDITTRENYYIFGIERGSSGTYNCKLVDTDIKMTHSKLNEWEFDLSFWEVL